MLSRIALLALLLPALLLQACYLRQDQPAPERFGIEGYQERKQERLEELERELEALLQDTLEMAEEQRSEFFEAHRQAEQEQQQLAAALEEDAPETEEDLPDYHYTMERRLDDLEQRVEALRLRATTSAGAFREQALDRLDQIAQQLQDLRVRLEGLDEDMRTAFEAQLADLEQRRESLRDELEERVGSENFEQIRGEFATSIATLRRDIRHVERDIEQELYEDGLPPADEETTTSMQQSTRDQ